MLQEGFKAPEFTLLDKEGNSISLKDFLGKKVILYFYPKDNTPGCTKQACEFAKNYEKFNNESIVVIGISKDSIKSHNNFANKYNLPFILLSDSELEVVQKYGVWQEKKLYGKVYFGIVRTTFLIDEQGNIEKIFEKFKPEENATQILEYLNA